MRILVVRNDKLGDFMLAWPALALIKRSRPEWNITALLPAYTAPMAALCPWLDELIIDEGEAPLALARKLRRQGFSAQLTLFSTLRVAMAGWLARIPYRLAPATKAAQLFYNHRLTQRRSRSEKPEYAYNLELAWQMLADHGTQVAPLTASSHESDWLPQAITRPLLHFPGDPIALKQTFCAQHGLETSRKLIFIHPGSGGSATNLRPQQYAQLANLLARDNPLAFVITAGPGEGATAQQVADAISAPVAIYDSAAGLAEFARTLRLADLFISGSTGPLHIAGALDRPTAAFYPGHRSATPLRWQTLNAPAHRLAFTPPADAEQHEVANIDIDAAATAIRDHFLSAQN